MARSTKKLTHDYLEDLALFEDAVYMPGTKKVVKGKPNPLPGALNPLPASLDEFQKAISNCMACPMGRERTHIVFADGRSDARIVFVGEAPGRNEDLQGKPFVGQAGQLLNKMLADVGLRREDVYICNVLKCRPPENRDPLPAEIAACLPNLLTQLSLIQPDILVCLGRHAVSSLLGIDSPMRDLRGRVVPWHDLQVMVTYHPAYYLRNSTQLATGMEDFRLLKKLYDELPKRAL
jgi:uracil-DNA glycosylase family 4